MVRNVKRKRSTTLKEIKDDLKLTVSETTISRRLKEKGYNSRVRQQKPWINDVNRKKRLKFAHAHKDWTVDQWKNVLWSDETSYTLRCHSSRKIWRQKQEKYSPECMRGVVKQDKRIRIWSCFSYDGVGVFHRYNGSLNAARYKKILIRPMKNSREDLFGDGELIFQHDNAPCHTALSIKTYLANKKIPVMTWPPSSPDLNPIENLWEILNDQTKDRKPKNEDELYELMSDAWESIDDDILHKLVESMPKRCAAVIENNGYSTKY